MGIQEDNLKNTETYEQLLAQHGTSYKSLNWGSNESQIKRFEVIDGIGIAKHDTILDVGCGLGDLYSWLKKKHGEIHYTGIDITPGMIEIAKSRFGDCCFVVNDIFEYSSNVQVKYDFVVASGIFYLRQFQPLEYMKQTILSMYSLARKRIAFNCLSTWAQKQEQREFYADPIDTLNFCRTITPFVTLRHDYHLADFTIYMGKQ